ncbi:hypothetical protein [Blastococcus sp. CCUG 61487]|uniref:hypothetical protein n=1 Tax=Blastococcus sp. CCUG 61487 TaxID=1840703 RepID=UPI0010C038C8|nr:hypothetical protein [Blastococcus sp. CCUG 61487]TKJ18655.1 hypothetical protein A6V29_11350 [Blastococcus sp. CCUG 61487]
MATLRTIRTTAVLLLLCGLAACAEPPGPLRVEPPATPSDDPGALVLRVQQVGGYTPPGADAARLPVVSVYADGRVFGLGPVAAIYPGFAWPNLQVRQVPVEQVQALVDRALEAGVGDTGDLGSPPLADVPTTRFTLVTAEQRFVREVYALAEGADGEGLTEIQRAARADLQSFLDELVEVAQPYDGSPEVYEPAAIAAVVRPWTAPEDDGSGLEYGGAQRWPGPPLPGEPIGPDVHCLVATGEEATAVRTAADRANELTRWEAADGTTWSVTFRPLLPDEATCGDLTG